MQRRRWRQAAALGAALAAGYAAPPPPPPPPPHPPPPPRTAHPPLLSSAPSTHLQIPCDPKLLLPPYSKDDIAAFKLTELEKDLKKVGCCLGAVGQTDTECAAWLAGSPAPNVLLQTKQVALALSSTHPRIHTHPPTRTPTHLLSGRADPSHYTHSLHHTLLFPPVLCC